jgi:uncharacterized protein
MHHPTRLVDRYGPWAVVTGASDGLGRACARYLADEGFRLVLVARRATELQRLADELQTAHQERPLVLALDLGHESSLAVLLQETAQLDVGLLVAAAGFGGAGPALHTDLGTALAMTDLNCRSVLAHTLSFGARFKTRARGGVVLFSSLLAFQGVPGSAVYAATKAYVQTLAEGLRPEWAQYGIDVLACAPGPVHTGFAQRAGMRMGLALAPERLPHSIFAALGHRETVRPGWLSWFLELILPPGPRRLRAWILARVIAGMTPPRHENC